LVNFKRDPTAWGIAVFWSGCMLFIDGLLASGVVETVQSESFETVQGVVTRCDLKRGRKGGLSLDLEYEYRINGQLYTGTKYHVDPQLVGNKYWEIAHKSLPVGAQVTVYFDREEPRTAFLAPGFRTDTLFLLWVLTPFNLVMLGFMYEGIWQLRRRRAFDPALSRCVWAAQDGYFARPHPDTQFLASAFAILLGVTFAGCFIIGGYVFTVELPPPLWIPLSMWALAFCVTVAFGVWESRQSLIHVNELEAAISFPVNWTRVTATRERVLGVETTTEIRKKKGLEDYEIFGVALRWRNDDGNEELTKFAEYDECADAEAFAIWLREKLGLAVCATGSARP
jgi:hypothetical protein